MNDLKSVFQSLKGRCHGNQFLLVLLASIHRIRFACHSVDEGVRQEVQVLRWTQADQLTGQLTIISRRLGDSRAGYRRALPCILFDLAFY